MAHPGGGIPGLRITRGRFSIRAERKMMGAAALAKSSRDAQAELSKELEVSYRTLLRRVHKFDLTFDPLEIRKIGIDDFSMCKGLIYCTIIYDLETKSILAIVDGRDKDAVVEALSRFKNVELICRDGSKTYKSVIDQLAKDFKRDIVQVTDKFHIVKLLVRCATQDFYDMKEDIMKELGIIRVDGQGQNLFSLIPASRCDPTDKKQKDFEDVHHLKGDGLSVREVIAKTGLSTYKVKKYWEQDSAQGSLKFNLNDYNDYLAKVIEEIKKGTSATDMFNKLSESGMKGKITGFRNWLKREYPWYTKGVRKDIREGNYKFDDAQLDDSLLPMVTMLNSPQIRYELGRTGSDGMDKVDDGKVTDIKKYRDMFALSKTLTGLHEVVVSFSDILAGDDPSKLQEWIDKYKSSPYKHVAEWAANLEENEKPYLENAIRTGYTNGPTEGKNSRVKCIKRCAGNRGSHEYLFRRLALASMFSETYREEVVDEVVDF